MVPESLSVAINRLRIRSEARPYPIWLKVNIFAPRLASKWASHHSRDPIHGRPIKHQGPRYKFLLTVVYLKTVMKSASQFQREERKSTECFAALVSVKRSLTMFRNNIGVPDLTDGYITLRSDVFFPSLDTSRQTIFDHGYNLTNKLYVK